MTGHAITPRDVTWQNGCRHAPGSFQIGEIAIDGAQADRITDPISQFASRKRLVRILLEESVQFLALFCPISHNLRMVRILYHIQHTPINDSDTKDWTPSGLE